MESIEYLQAKIENLEKTRLQNEISFSIHINTKKNKI